MNEAMENVCVSETVEENVSPVPACVPGEFTVRLGEGWGGSLHDLADGLSEWELGAEAAVGLLLTWLEWVEVEVGRFPDLVDSLHLLRGAVMTAGSSVLGRYVLA
jgi:hypothetical protein